MFSRINQLLLALNHTSNKNPYAGDHSRPRYRSEGMATLLALFPGAIIHGSGHIYAGGYAAGAILFAIEISSAYLMVYTLAPIAGENLEVRHEFLGNVLCATGIIGFFGSWIYDIVHADAAVRKHNDRIRAQIQYHGDQGKTISISLAFSF